MKEKIIRGLKIGGAVLFIALAFGIVGKMDQDSAELQKDINAATVRGLYERGL